MAIVPTNKQDRLVFYEGHIGMWTEHYSDLGITSAECAALAALITAGRAAYTTQVDNAAIARASTSDANIAIAAIHALGAPMIAKIKAYAETTNDPGVLNTAGLPQPSPDSPVGPPGKPTDFTVLLNQGGSLTIKWKCTNPIGGTGTVYEVQRRLSPGGPFTYVGVSGGDKTYNDETLPAGSTGVAYRVTGLRSGLRGPTVQCDVNFGVSGGGGGGFAVSDVTETEVVNAQMAA